MSECINWMGIAIALLGISLPTEVAAQRVPTAEQSHPSSVSTTTPSQPEAQSAASQNTPVASPAAASGAAQGPTLVYQVVENPRRPWRQPYEEGMSVPPGAYVTERSRTGLTISGAVIFGVFYLSSVFSWSVDYAIQGGDSDTGTLVIPVVGPLVTIPFVSKDLAPLLVLDTIAQTAGVTIFILGLVLKSKYIVYAQNAHERPKFAFSPMVSPQASGLSFRAYW